MNLSRNIGGHDKVTKLDIFQIHRASERWRYPKAINLSFARLKASAVSFAGQPDHEVLILAFSGIQRSSEVTLSLPTPTYLTGKKVQKPEAVPTFKEHIAKW